MTFESKKLQKNTDREQIIFANLSVVGKGSYIKNQGLKQLFSLIFHDGLIQKLLQSDS